MSVPSPAPAPGVFKAHNRQAQLGGAASRSYNVASLWEETAALSEEELRIIDQIGQLCSTRPFPAHVKDADAHTAVGAAGEPKAPGAAKQAAGAAAVADDGTPKEAYVGTLEDAVLHNTNQFHKWYSELEAACALETEEKYQRYGDLLVSHSTGCQALIDRVDATLQLFDGLGSLHRDVASRSKALFASCEALVREKEQLVEFADALRAKLKFFDEFEAVYSQLQSAQVSLDSDQFLSLLRRLDDCIAYVAANPQYADSVQYGAKFRQLQARALGTVKSKVQQVLRHATQQVAAAVAESTGGAPAAAGAAAGGGASQAQQPLTPTPQQVAALSGGAEMSALYVRFRAAAEPGLKGLFKEIEARARSPEYQRLLKDCQALYCASRLAILSPFVQQRLKDAEVASGGSLPQATRHSCEHLLRAAALEMQLFETFFASAKDGGAEALAPLVDPLATLLYDALRPRVIHLQDIDELCEVVDILKHEVLGDVGARQRGAATVEALRPLLSRCLEDVQARLIYRCQAFIKDEVASYAPAPADLDYPILLEQQAAERRASAGGAAAADGSSNGGNGDNGAAASNGADGASAPYALVFNTLFPPVRSTLLLLSKLYRAVDARTFGGLAQEAVAACTLSAQAASRAIAKKAGPLDAQLFLIRHLLFLREQIAPFDVDFAATDIDLDFTHMREQMQRMLTGGVSLLALTSANGVAQILNKAQPRVLTFQVDSKKELEKQLKAVCESFIMALTKAAVDPMLSFITKVTAVRVAANARSAAAAAAAASATASGGAQQAQPLPPAPKKLREQAFASPDKLAELVGRVNQALRGPLQEAVAKMRLYLANPSTHAVLFKPVKSNIAEAHGQIATLLEGGDYTPEEVASVPLMAPQQLAALLDSMC